MEESRREAGKTTITERHRGSEGWDAGQRAQGGKTHREGQEEIENEHG